uniref:Type IV pilus twitching motility protein PilT n=1 Tax=candidate division WOR-3 bacterium TaxID=2052148 RepID=A0A7V3ZT28_UNCW3
MPVTMRQLLEEMVHRDATDLHISAGSPPLFRIDGILVPSNYDVLTKEEAQQLVYSVMTEEQKKKLEEEWEVDFSFGITGLSRFRANAYKQRGSISIAIRTIPYKIRSFEELGLPPVVEEFASRQKGLVLVTGPTGHGKSTTLASIIEKINNERRCHILTIEDPIEYLFANKKAYITQRQVESDTKSFARALKYALRQDPDVVMIGEMRDLETIAAALTISETGHLTLATLHTNSAVESVNRIIDVFPPHQQQQVRTQLAFVILGIITQALLPKIGGGRVLACEVLVATPAVKAMIRDNKVHQIYSLMQAGQKYGMQTMNQSLYKLYMQRKITLETALSFSRDPEELERMIKEKSPIVK